MSREVSKVSNYVVHDMIGYREPDNFDKAIDQHNGAIQQLQSIIKNLESRIVVLQIAKSKEVFSSPGEYDDYIVSSFKTEEINRKLREKEAAEKARIENEKMRVEREKQRLREDRDESKEFIREYLNYSLRCQHY